MRKIDIKMKFNPLIKVFDMLEEGVEIAKDELDKNGVIQRFEFTVELFWNFLKFLLNYNQIECYSSRDCIKKAYKYNFIGDDEILFDMLEDRNLL